MATENVLSFEDCLDDVHTRFLLNLPAEELASADRIFFQIEQAWWFYEDHICDNLTEQEAALLPRYSNLKPFAIRLFEFSPLLDSSRFNDMWQQFSAYKRQISTYGMILMDAACEQMILCQTWTGSTWTLPAGKINQGESPLQSASRECYEETGFDCMAAMGAAKDLDKTSWNVSEHALSYQEANGKRRTYYVCSGVPTDFSFAPVARKEVSKVEWFSLDALPKKTFGVLPVMGKLRHWIRKHTQKKNKRSKSRGNNNKSNPRPKSATRDKSAGRDKSNGRRIQNQADPLVDAGLANVGDQARWSEEEMFLANEQLLGRKVAYDGNPHVFAEQGFQGIDPHAFRVVGGGFMNSADGLLPEISKTRASQNYQPLVKSDRSAASSDHDDVLPLTPFFTSDGATPWGEVIAEAANTTAAMTTSTINPGEALLQMLQKGGTTGSAASTSGKAAPVVDTMKQPDNDDDLDVLTDQQITRASQERFQQKQRLQIQYEEDMEFIQQWVAKLPNPINFCIPNVKEIMQEHFGSF